MKLWVIQKPQNMLQNKNNNKLLISIDYENNENNENNKKYK